MFGTDAFTTKPYVASAAYIKRQSGLSAKGRGPAAAKHGGPCARCRFDPDRRSGDGACPFNAMYWDFLARNRGWMSENPRVRALFGTLDRWGDAEVAAIRRAAEAHRDTLVSGGYAFAIDEDAG